MASIFEKLNEAPVESNPQPQSSLSFLSQPSTSSSITNQIITYPTTSERKEDAEAGVWVFDLRKGVAKNPSGVGEEMSSSLEKIQDSMCRSALIIVSDADAKIKIGDRKAPFDHSLIHLIQNLEFDSIEIEFPSGRTPANNFEFVVCASNSPIFPIMIDQSQQHFRDKYTGASVAAYTIIANLHCGGYDQVMFVIENTHGANGLTAKIEFSEDGVDYYIDPDFNAGAELNIAFGDKTIYATSIKHHFYQVSVKNQVAGNASSYKIHQNLIR
jgi:hypothetical protein